MKRFSKKERKEIYLGLAHILHEAIERGSVKFICNELRHTLKVGLGYNIKDIPKTLPELGLTIMNCEGLSWNDFNKQSMQEDTKERIYAVLLAAAMCD